MESFFHVNFQSSVGDLHLVATKTHLVALIFEGNWKRWKENYPTLRDQSNSILKESERQLRQYFAKERKDFDLPLQMRGTEFQQKSWKALQKIAYGKTISYQTQAQWIQKPKAVRAVGTANGRNPISIIVPCHRVIASNGSLAGYGGGLELKKKLLQIENIEFDA